MTIRAITTEHTQPYIREVGAMSAYEARSTAALVARLVDVALTYTILFVIVVAVYPLLHNELMSS